VYWVLDGDLRCACVRVRVRARAMSVCVCACVQRSTCAFACVLICVFVFICARACCERARVSVRVCVPVLAHVRAFCAFQSDCIFARACVASVCVRLAAACALPSHGGDVRYQWLGPRRALRPGARGCAWCHRPGSRASAAGVNWTSRTAKAEWAGRYFHTSVIDAAGAIYVIGGHGTTTLNDVWASTDGGARAGLGPGGGGGGGGTGWVSRSTRGVL
jgi:hypothetical protein